MTTHRTGWLTSYADATDNYLHVFNRADSTLYAWNESRGYSSTLKPGYPSWFDDVVDWSAAPGRRGDYTLLASLGGPDVTFATGCAFTHAQWGDVDSLVWKGTCPLVVSGSASDASTGVSHLLDLLHSPIPPHAATSTNAQVYSKARGAWLLPFLANMPPEGTASVPYDPAGEGVPAEFVGSVVREWESPTVELVKVEIAVDDTSIFSNPLPSDNDDLMVIDVNPGVRPGYISGAWDTDWPLGNPPGVVAAEYMADGVTPKPHTSIYEDRSGLIWNEYAGLDSFTKCFDRTAGDEPDFVTTLWTTGGHDGTVNLRAGSSSYEMALRVWFQSPRYRWVWDEPPSPAPRRVIGRQKDGLVGGGRRVIGGGRTAQNRNRTIGKTW